MTLLLDTAPPTIHPGDSDSDESLSLCDLPIMTHLRFDSPDLPRERRLPPPPPTELFEFIHDLGAEMCAADDIFLRGQLLPHKFKPLPSPPPTPTTPRPPTPLVNHAHEDSKRFQTVHRKPRHLRSESLDGFELSRLGGGPATRCWRGRGSLSADYRKLRTVTETTTACPNRNGRRVGSCEVSVPVPVMPKWYVFMFGTVRVPAEMEMKDIKSRQKRRNPSSFGMGSDGRKTAPVSSVGCEGKIGGGGGGGGGGPWKLLSSLSCKGDVDAVVTVPLSFGLT